jgi:hypothetical protein
MWVLLAHKLGVDTGTRMEKFAVRNDGYALLRIYGDRMIFARLSENPPTIHEDFVVVSGQQPDGGKVGLKMKWLGRPLRLRAKLVKSDSKPKVDGKPKVEAKPKATIR